MPYRKEMFVMNVLVVLCFCIYPLESRFNGSSPLVVLRSWRVMCR